MRRIIWFLLLLLLIAFVLIQFFQPEKNKGEASNKHIFSHEEVPEHIKNLLQDACFNCHSNNTNYWWYNKVAPVSWMVDSHIKEGKLELNFSEWADLDIFEKITILEEICQETKRKSMPLKSYRVMHPKAKLNDEQIAVLCTWANKLAEELLANADVE